MTEDETLKLLDELSAEGYGTPIFQPESWECDYCEWTERDLRDLATHMRTKHLGHNL